MALDSDAFYSSSQHNSITLEPAREACSFSVRLLTSQISGSGIDGGVIGMRKCHHQVWSQTEAP